MIGLPKSDYVSPYGSDSLKKQISKKHTNMSHKSVETNVEFHKQNVKKINFKPFVSAVAILGTAFAGFKLKDKILPVLKNLTNSMPEIKNYGSKVSTFFKTLFKSEV